MTLNPDHGEKAQNLSFRESDSLLRTDINLIYDEIKETMRRIITANYSSDVIPELKVWEIGVAWGQRLRMLLEFGFAPDHLFGLDLIPHFIDVARKLSPPGMQYQVCDARTLPYSDRFFDIVIQCITFSSILNKDVRIHIGREMMRVLSPSGLIIWIDNADSRDRCKYQGQTFYQGIDFHEVKNDIFPGADIQRYPKSILKKETMRKCMKHGKEFPGATGL